MVRLSHTHRQSQESSRTSQDGSRGSPLRDRGLDTNVLANEEIPLSPSDRRDV